MLAWQPRPYAVGAALGIYALAVFAFDVLLPLGVAGALLNLALPILATFLPCRRAIELATVTALVSTLAGIPFKPDWAPTYVIALNRLLIAFGILLIAAAVLYSRALERRHRDTSRNLETFFSAARDGILAIDSRGRIRRFNPAAERLFGYAAAEVLGESLSVLLPEPHASAHDTYLERYYETGLAKVVGAGCPVEGLRRDGSRVPIDVAVTDLGENVEPRFTAIVRDLSGEREATRRIHESEERFRAIFESSPVPATVWELRGRDLQCVAFNRAAAIESKGSVAALRGRLARDLYADQPEVLTLLETALAERRSASRELEYLMLVERSPRRVELTATPVGDERVLVYFRDVTEQRATEERARRAADFESLLLSATSELINLPLDRIDQAIESVLRQATAYLTVDSATVAAIGSRRGIPRVTHHWQSPNGAIGSLPEQLGQVDFSWEIERLAAGEAIAIASPEGAPSGVTGAGELLRRLGAAAALALPIRGRSGSVGVLGVVSAAPREWCDDEMRSLRILAGVVGGALERRQRESVLLTLQNAIHETDDHVLITDREGRIEYANPAFERQTGYRLAEIRGSTPRILKSGEHPASFYDELWSTVLTGRVFRGEFVNRNRHGETYLEEKVIAPIRDADGSITHFVSTGRDVTARRAADRELRRSRAALLEAQQIAHVGNWDADLMTGALEASEETYRIYGLDPPSSPSRWQDLLDLTITADRPALSEARRRAIAERRPYELEYRIRRGAASERWVLERARVVFDTSGLPMRMIGTSQDVTERKRAEEEQRGLRQRLERAADEWLLTFDSIDFPVLLLDGHRRIRRVNVAAARALARTPGACVGRVLDEIASEEPCRTGARAAEAAAAERRQVILSAHGPSAGQSWEIRAGWHQRAERGDAWIVLTARDLTEVIRLRESLERSRLMSAMGSLVAGVAHEVRNPLFGISATLDTLEALRNEDAELGEFLELMRKQVTRLSVLMQDLLIYGRPIAIERTPVEIAAILQDALELNTPVSVETGVDVGVEIASGMPPLQADRARLMLAVRNLLDNACRHSPRGGRVRLRARLEGAGRNQVMRIDVEDDGPGFDPSILPHVFEPFFTRRRAGTGLGLSIVERCMQQHGGSASAGNRPGGGAIVTLRLPLEPPPADADEAPASSADPG